MKIFSTLREGGYVPFGPFLVGAGLTAMIATPKAMLDTVLRAFGL
jgi:leader peptidase (prepilin peptidase)/N-methyltransferase